MKKINFIIICVIISCISMQILNRLNTSKYFINSIIPYINVITGEGYTFKKVSYIDVLKSKNLNTDLFTELPEDRVENIIDEPAPVTNDEVISGTENIEFNEPKPITLEWNKVLKNETKYKIDVEKLKSEKLKFGLKNKGTEVIIYHTHATESYTESKNYKYEKSGVFRTLNKNANVVRIGNEIAKILKSKDIISYHDETLYDNPTYNLSYSKAGKAIETLTKKYSSAKIVLDIHRDAISVGTEGYKPVVKVNGKNVAQFLIVIGTNQGGLSHPNWKENLKLALKIKELADKEYPGLCRYVILRKERFNQQVTPGAMIVEMGATGNTVEEVLETSKLFSDLLIKAVKE